MSQEKILLSICLPTRNQPEAVDALLKQLSQQFVAGLEIIIRDDSARDLTEDIIKKYQDKIPINYTHETREQESYDSKIAYLVKAARGKYTWCIGDDLLAPKAIETVFSILNKHDDLTFLWVNSAAIEDPNFTSIKDKNSYFFANKNDVLRKFDIGMLGFMSVTIFNRKIALDCFEEAQKIIGLGWVGLYINLYVISRGKKSYYIGTPIVLCQPKPPGQVRSYDHFEVFGISLIQTVRLFENEFEPNLIHQSIAKNLVQVLKAILVERSLGFKAGFASPKPKIIPLLTYYSGFWQLWVYLPLLLVPTFLLKFLYKLFRFVKSLVRR